MSKAPRAPRATIVVFGSLGDLTRRLLIPALANLARSDHLAEDTAFIGLGREDGDDEFLAKTLDAFVDDSAAWQRLRKQTRYLKGDFTEPATFKTLGKMLSGNVVFYLATAPDFFGPIVDQLADAALFDEKDGFRRVVIEKPFGHDVASARTLNAQLLARIAETQIFRIDHFLGKETVQNIMIARFGNVLSEAIWNNRFIDHVQITAAETVTVGSRGKFYDTTGALRDMVPNHLFQLLALVGMEPPNTLTPEAIRTEKAKVLEAVQPVSPGDAVRGRYTAGTVAGEPVGGYTETQHVDDARATETYVAVKVLINTWRWTGVPFYLRTGKVLTARDTEIVIQFRDRPLALYAAQDGKPLPANRLILQIQPREGLTLDINVKYPGPLPEAIGVSMDFSYADRFGANHSNGYETLLYDVFTGDQTLFQRADQIEFAWASVQAVLEAWAKCGKPEDYAAGTAGPAAADTLLTRDGRTWHELS